MAEEEKAIKTEKVKERKMKPTEFAVEDNLDPHLFLYWKDELMEKKDYEALKKKVYNPNKHKI